MPKKAAVEDDNAALNEGYKAIVREEEPAPAQPVTEGESA